MELKSRETRDDFLKDIGRKVYHDIVNHNEFGSPVLSATDLKEIVSEGSAGRHFVFRIPNGYIGKISITERSLAPQKQNLGWIAKVNKIRRKEGFTVDDYIRSSRLVFYSEKGFSYLVMGLIDGENLYQKIKDGSAESSDFESSVIQIARLNVEGKIQNPELKPLIDPEKRKSEEGFIHQRFQEIGIEQLYKYNNLEISDYQKRKLLRNLWAIEEEFDGIEALFYCDSGPRNIIWTDKGEHLIDVEDLKLLPPNLGLVSLFQYGMKYLKEDKIERLIDRYLLEVERAKIIANEVISVEERKKLIGPLDEYIIDKYINDSDGKIDAKELENVIEEEQVRRLMDQREKILNSMPYASAWKHFEWAGHKASFTYRSKKENSIKEYITNAVEQIRHLNLAIEGLQRVLERRLSVKKRKALLEITEIYKDIKNQMMRWDGNTHTSFSDGDNRPEELLEEAVTNGLYLIGMVDHDTTLGYQRAREIFEAVKSYDSTKLSKKGVTSFTLSEGGSVELDYSVIQAILNNEIELVGGIELTTKMRGKYVDGLEIHLLGYGVNDDIENDPIIQTNQCSRHLRSLKIINKYQERGVKIKPEEIECDGPFISKWHIAKEVYNILKTKSDSELREMGFPELTGCLNEENFIKEIRGHTSRRGFAHLDFDECNLEIVETYKGAELLNSYGTSVVLAHPGEIYDDYVRKNNLGENEKGKLEDIPKARKFLKRFIVDLAKNHNLRGIEVYCFMHTQARADSISELVDEINIEYKLDLQKTFGSDYHGTKIMPDIVLGVGNTILSDDAANRGRDRPCALKEILKYSCHQSSVHIKN